MPNQSTLEEVRQSLIGAGYNPPEYAEFEQDMQDDGALEEVRMSLKNAGFDPPEFDEFKTDMGLGDSVQQPSSNVGNTVLEQAMDANNRRTGHMPQDVQDATFNGTSFGAPAPAWVETSRGKMRQADFTDEEIAEQVAATRQANPSSINATDMSGMQWTNAEVANMQNKRKRENPNKGVAYQQKESWTGSYARTPDEFGEMHYGWQRGERMKRLNKQGVEFAGYGGHKGNQYYNEMLDAAERMSDDEIVATYDKITKAIGPDTDLRWYANTDEGYIAASQLKALQHELHARDLGFAHDRDVENPGMEDYAGVRTDQDVADLIDNIASLSPQERDAMAQAAYDRGLDGGVMSVEDQNTMLAVAALRSKDNGRRVEENYRELQQQVEYGSLYSTLERDMDSIYSEENAAMAQRGEDAVGDMVYSGGEGGELSWVMGRTVEAIKAENLPGTFDTMTDRLLQKSEAARRFYDRRVGELSKTEGIIRARAMARDELRQMFRTKYIENSPLTPKSDAQYIFQSVYFDNMWSKMAQAGLGLAAGKPYHEMKATLDEGMQMYAEQQASTAARIIAPCAVLVFDAATGSFLPAGAASKTAVNLFGKGANQTVSWLGKRLFGIGSEAAIRRMGENTALRILGSAIGGSANFATYEFESALFGGAASGNLNGRTLGNAALGGAGKGFVFGFVGGVAGKATEGLTGFNALLGEVGTIAAEGTTFTAMDYLSNGHHLTPEIVGTSFGMAIAGRMAHPVEYASNLLSRVVGLNRKNAPNKPPRISKEMQARLRDDYPALTALLSGDGLAKDIAKAIKTKGGKANADERLKAIEEEYRRLKFDNNVPWGVVRIAEYVVNGRVIPQPWMMNCDIRTDGDGNEYGVTLDGEGRTIEEYKFHSEKDRDKWRAATSRQCDINRLNVAAQNMRRSEFTDVLESTINEIAEAQGMEVAVLRDVVNGGETKDKAYQQAAKEVQEAVDAKLKSTEDPADVAIRTVENKYGISIEQALEYPVYQRTEREARAVEELQQRLNGDYSPENDMSDTELLENEQKQSHDSGYQAEGEQLAEVKERLENAAESLGQMGVNPEEIDKMDNTALAQWMQERDMDAETAAAVMEYQNAKAAFEGVRDRINDDSRDRIEESNQQTDDRTNKKSGMLHRVSVKPDNENDPGREAYVIDGKITINEDGTVDLANSDKEVVVAYTDGSKPEMRPIEDVLNGEQPIDPKQVKEETATAITEEVAGKAVSQMNRELAFNDNDTFTILAGGKPVELTVVGHDPETGDPIVQDAQGNQQIVTPKVLQEMHDEWRESQRKPQQVETPAEETPLQNNGPRDNAAPRQERPAAPTVGGDPVERVAWYRVSGKSEQRIEKEIANNLETARQRLADAQKAWDETKETDDAALDALERELNEARNEVDYWEKVEQYRRASQEPENVEAEPRASLEGRDLELPKQQEPAPGRRPAQPQRGEHWEAPNKEPQVNASELPDGFNEADRRFWSREGEDVVEMMDEAAKQMGLSIVTYDDPNGENGYIQNGVIYLNSAKGRAAVSFVMGHEMTHEMQRREKEGGEDGKVYTQFRELALAHAEAIYKPRRLNGVDYNTYKDYLNARLEQYQEHIRETTRNRVFKQQWDAGLDNDAAMEIAKREADAAANKFTMDDILDETAADVAGSMLANPDMAREVLGMEQDLGRLARYKQAFMDWLERTLAKMTGRGEEYERMKQLEQSLQDLWRDAVKKNRGDRTQDQDRRYSLDTHAQQFGLRYEKGEDGITHFYEDLGRDADGNPIRGREITTFMPVHIENSPVGAVLKQGLRDHTISKEQYDRTIKNQCAIMQYMKDTKDLDMFFAVSGAIGFAQMPQGGNERVMRDYYRMDSQGRAVFVPYKSNSETQYGNTFDVTTICRKTQTMIDVMSETMKAQKHGLTVDEVIKIVYDNVYKMGKGRNENGRDIMVPCNVCYVFNRWVNLGNLFDTMRQLRDRYSDMSTEQIKKERIKNIQALCNEYKKQGNTLEFKKYADYLDQLNWWSNATNQERAIDKANGDKIKNRLDDYGKKVVDLMKARLAEVDEELNALTFKLFNYERAAKKADAEKFTAADRKRMEQLKDEKNYLEKGTWFDYVRLQDDYKPIPDDILFDINRSYEFKEHYAGAWKYRTTRGSGMGKAAAAYSPEYFGSGIVGAAKDADAARDMSENLFMVREPGEDGKWHYKYIDEETWELKPEAVTLLRKAQDKAAAQNYLNGQRFQSTSDARVEYLTDYNTYMLEQMLIGSKGQGFTKVPECAKLFGDTGTMFNLSLIAKGKGYEDLTQEQYDALSDEDKRDCAMIDGVWRHALYSDVSGINHGDAFALSDAYANLQPIMVTINNIHARLCMALASTGRITFNIPYHASGGTESYYLSKAETTGDSMDMTSRADYSDYETDKVIDASDKVAETARSVFQKIKTGADFTKNEMAYLQSLDHDNVLRQLYMRFRGVDVDGSPARILNKYLLKEDRDTAGVGYGSRDSQCRIQEWDSKTGEYLTDADGNPVYKQVKLSGGKDGTANLLMTNDYWDRTLPLSQADRNGEAFLELCQQLGYRPRFSGWKKDKNKGWMYNPEFDFTKDTGYWSNLIDISMYDQDGNPIEQGSIDASAIGVPHFKKDEMIQLGGRTLTPMEANPNIGSEVMRDIVRQNVSDVAARRAKEKAEFAQIVREWSDDKRSLRAKGALFGGKRADIIPSWIRNEWDRNPQFVKEIAKMAKLSPEQLEKQKAKNIEAALQHAQDTMDEYYREGGETDATPQFSLIDDPEEIRRYDEEIERGEYIVRYRAMADIDGLRAPMSTKNDGMLREAAPRGAYERADETDIDSYITPEIAEQIKALQESGRTGEVVVIPGKVKFVKGAKSEGMQFHLVKPDGTDLWAAYNPYIHTSDTPLNDQFASAWRRPELKIVRVLIPKSAIQEGNPAKWAKDDVGDDKKWNGGVVDKMLPEDQRRKVALAKYVKIDDIVSPDEAVAMYADKLIKNGIAVPFNVVTPAEREALVRAGVEIGEPSKKAGKDCFAAYEAWKNGPNPDGPKGGARFSLGDEDYRQAVESGDEKRVAKMVRDAVKAAMPNTKVVDKKGNPLIVYHGTPRGGYTVFNQGFFTDYRFNATKYGGRDKVSKYRVWESMPEPKTQEEIEYVLKLMNGYYKGNKSFINMISKDPINFRYEDGKFVEYRGNEKLRTYDTLSEMQDKVGRSPVHGTGGIYECYLNIENPIVIDVNDNWTRVPARFKAEDGTEYVFGPGEFVRTDAVVRYFKTHESPYDGIIFTNISEDTPKKITDYIPLSPEQVKSADPVTYDNDGNLIPLSERFNPEKKDIRFSLSDEQREAQTHSENFKKWFGDWENDPENSSKVVDDQGRPLVVYHQTNAKRWINRETGEDWEKLDWRKKMEWDNRPQEEWEDTWEEQDFYTFDDRYARQSIEMPAIFFSPENDPHHEYGNRTIAVYLNMRNPAINPDIPNRGVTDTAGREAMETLKAQGYDGFIRTDEDGNILEYGVFDSNQVKSADENNGDFSRENPDIRFSLAGEQGAVRLDALDNGSRMQDMRIAEDMERAGKDAKAIKLATGWERGADGKWRYEIMDKGIKDKFPNNPDEWIDSTTCPLSSIIDNEELFNAYPELKTATVEIRFDMNPRIGGSAGENHIDLNAEHMNVKVLGATLKRYWPKAKELEMSWNHFKKYHDEIVNNGDIPQFDFIISASTKRTLAHEIQHLIQRMDGFARGTNSGDPNYRKTAGEVEARNVETRYIMSEGKRRDSLAEETEDVPRSEQIVKFSLADPFYSNAARAVEGVKQEKAKAEQWKAMLSKAGGIKAGEDKWMGLSTWLDEHKGETLTKEEVRQFVAENGIQMEERHYGDVMSLPQQKAIESLQKELDEIAERKLKEQPLEPNDAIIAEAYDMAWEEMIENHGGDDFNMAFEMEQMPDGTFTIQPTMDWNDEISDAAKYFLGIDGSETSPEPINTTRERFTTDGLKNKREIAFVVPGVGPYQESDEIHFGPENQGRAIMWVRFGEATDADGNRVLVIDEVQSNRHQDAREKGYADPKAVKAFNDWMDAKAKEFGVQPYQVESRLSDEEYHKMMELANAAKYDEGAIPAAPFEKNWHEVAMKRMLRLAAEEGFDKVAWTTGEQQARRYDLGQVIDKIVFKKETGAPFGEPDRIFYPMKCYKDGELVKEFSPAEENLEELVGRDIANEMKASGFDGENTIEKDLITGNVSGMQGFYDKMLPQFMNKYGKRWGVKVGEVTLDTPGKETMHSVDVNEDMRRSVMEQGQPLFSLSEDVENYQPESWEHSVLERVLEHAGREGSTREQRNEAVRSVNRSLADLFRRMTDGDTDNLGFDIARGTRQATAAQRKYDRWTVDSLVSMAKSMLKSGMYKGLSPFEVTRLVGKINEGAGRDEIQKQMNTVFDVLMNANLKGWDDQLRRLMTIPYKRINQQGVRVMGRVDDEGARMLQSLHRGMELTQEELANKIAEVSDRLGSDNDTEAKDAANELEGLLLAQQYEDLVGKYAVDNQDIKDQIRQQREKVYIFWREEVIGENGMPELKRDGTPKTVEKYRLKPEFGGMDEDGNRVTPTEEAKQFRQQIDRTVAELENARRENQVRMSEGYKQMTDALGGDVAAAVTRAKQFRENEKLRKQEIYHAANSDLLNVNNTMQGMDRSKETRFANSKTARLFLGPLATFENMFRYLGKRSAYGEGRLFNMFVRPYMEHAHNEWQHKKAGMDEMDNKAQELFGYDWIRLGEKMRDADKFPPITVSFWDNNNYVTRELRQDEAVYLYCVSKMRDGRMKLEPMGIDENTISQMVQQIDPNLVKLADWYQHEFLPKQRDRYNQVYERMFGTSMAHIDNYIHLNVLDSSIPKNEEIGDAAMGQNMPRTITGSLKERKTNVLPIDIHTSLIDLAMDQHNQMEHWAEWAEYGRDLKDLINYNNFKAKVKNMSSVEYGSGEDLLKEFRNAVAIATGDMRSPGLDINVDSKLGDVAKAVSSAKITLRSFTALKQTLSFPAFMSDARPGDLIFAASNAMGSIEWAMNNLPGFAKRWQSRQVGDTRLMETDSDAKIWKRRFVNNAVRIGLTPNAAVDCMTVAIGARGVYLTAKRRYLSYGYTDEQAERKALQDAAISYNSSQQSSEGAFTSKQQVDRSLLSIATTVFRNASMGYERRLTTGMRNLKNMAKSGYREEVIENTKKQMMEEGLTEEQAQRAAERVYNRAKWHSMMDVVNYGFLLPFFWNLGPAMIYILGGDDGDEKKNLVADCARHAIFGPVEGLTFGGLASELSNHFLGSMVADGKTFRETINALQYRSMNPLPLYADVQGLWTTFGKDFWGGMTDLTNLIAQGVTGVNPETVTDMGVALLDACEGDLGLAKETGFFLMRLANMPKSQVDKIYMDELGIGSKEASKMSWEELAKRYARYNARKDAPIAAALLSDEAEAGREEKYIDKFWKRVKAKLEEASDDELRQVYGRGDESRKMVAAETAKRAGVDDRYSEKPKSNTKPETAKAMETYQRMRSYTDMADDILLQKAKADAAAAGDEERASAIEKELSKITDLRNGKDKRAGMGSGDRERDKRILEQIREVRRKALDKYGLK